MDRPIWTDQCEDWEEVSLWRQGKEAQNHITSTASFRAAAGTVHHKCKMSTDCAGMIWTAIVAVGSYPWQRLDHSSPCLRSCLYQGWIPISVRLYRHHHLLQTGIWMRGMLWWNWTRKWQTLQSCSGCPQHHPYRDGWEMKTLLNVQFHLILQVYPLINSSASIWPQNHILLKEDTHHQIHHSYLRVATISVTGTEPEYLVTRETLPAEREPVTSVPSTEEANDLSSHSSFPMDIEPESLVTRETSSVETVCHQLKRPMTSPAMVASFCLSNNSPWIWRSTITNS